MKKRLILIAAICLAAALFALPAAADGTITGTCGDGVTWEYVTATDTLMISGSGEITDPTWFEYEEYDIAANALTLFLNNNNGSLTEIANGAFKDFEKLERVTLPDSITYIGDNAFAGCRSLVYVGFEGTLDQWGKVEIGSGNDAILTSKPMPYGNCGDGVTWKYSEASKTLTISGNGVISDTPGFVAFCEKLVINEGITAIGNWIFASSISQLNELVLPSSLKSIGDNAFAECTNLNTVVIPGSVENIGASAFRNCNITSLTIGDGCKAIGAYAFQNSAISKLELPESIETIAAGAFSGCSKLETVSFNEGLTSIGKNAFEYCISLNSLHIPGSVKTISDRAFAECHNIAEIELENGVEYIGKCAFSHSQYTDYTGQPSNQSLTSVEIPESVTFLGEAAFADFTNLQEVVFNDGLEFIDDGTFMGCTKLKSVILPDTLKSIENSAFSGCSALKAIDLPEGFTTLGNASFYGCSALESIDIPAPVSIIDSLTFHGCVNLRSVKFNSNENLLSIGGGAFKDCWALEDIDIPDSVMSIGSGCFQGCAALKKVGLSERLVALPEFSFYGCPSLTSITLPDMVTSIGDEAFSGCSGLETLTVGEFVNSVGGAAFYGCEELTLRVCAGSYMQAYAEAYDIDYELIPGTTEDAVGIASITSARGVDTAGKACTVVTITLTNGETEVFYVYDGEQGEPGEPGEIIVAESFSDVAEGAYYSDAVAWAVANGITTGTGDGRFSPNAPCTRAQVVTFLWRAMGSPEPAGTAGFADVGAGEYYAKAVRWALEKGITAGTGAGTFSPNAECTRAQVVTFLARALGAAGGGVSGFADVPDGAYYADAVAWAVAKGITTGTGAGTFSPDAGCTRGQIVTFLFRAAA